MEARSITEVLADAKPYRSAQAKLARIELAERHPRKKKLVFLVSGMAQCGLPHTRQSELVWVRKNKDCQMTLTGSPEVGLPFGVLPRLLLMHFFRYVRLKKTPIIDLEHITDFLRSMNMAATGGANGSIKRVRHQIEALLRTKIEIKVDGYDHYTIKNSVFFGEGVLWSNCRSGYLKMSDEMYAAARRGAVPYSLLTIEALQSSPLTLDLYCWAKWRAKQLFRKNPHGKVEVEYDDLHGPNGQTGAMYEGYDECNDIRTSFVRKVKDSVRRINAVDSDLLLSVGPDGIVLRALPP